MFRTCCLMVAFGCVAIFTASADVSLSGTVKDGDGAVVAGAVVKLQKMTSAPADTTDTQGAFSISAVGVKAPVAVRKQEMLQLGIKGGSVQFAISSPIEKGNIGIFSGNGRLAGSIALNNLQPGVFNKAIPKLSPGSYVMNITIDQLTVVRKLINTGSELYLSGDAASSAKSGAFSISAAAAAAVDTLLVSKSGFTTAKVELDSYVKSGIAIVLKKDDGPVACKLSDLPATSALKVNKKLPNPFAFFDGTEITKKSEWPCLRKEILNMAYKYMYGPMPPFEAPDVEVKGTVSSSSVKAEISYKGKSATLTFGTSGSGDILLISMGAGINPPSTYKYRTYSISNTVIDGWKNNCKNLFGITPCGEIAVGWGCNILCRAISSNPDGGIDSNKIMTTGCSNTAKAAFLAAAFCEGIDLTVVVESGGFGDASFRVAQYLYNDKNGWKCSDAPQGVGSPDHGSQWLAEPYMDATASAWVVNTPANIYKLPYDQHCLAACIAPRAACLLTNQNGQAGSGEWCHLNGTGSAISYWAAEPVWNALGVPENFGGRMYTESSAPQHCSNPPPASAKELANEFFKRVFDGDKTAKTDVLDANDADLQQPKADWKSTWVDWDMEKKLE